MRFRWKSRDRVRSGRLFDRLFRGVLISASDKRDGGCVINARRAIAADSERFSPRARFFCNARATFPFACGFGFVLQQRAVRRTPWLENSRWPFYSTSPEHHCWRCRPRRRPPKPQSGYPDPLQLGCEDQLRPNVFSTLLYKIVAASPRVIGSPSFASTSLCSWVVSCTSPGTFRAFKATTN